MNQIVAALKPILDEINGRFAEMDGKFDRLNARFDGVHAEFERIDSRFEKLDREVADVKGTVRRTAVEVSRIKGDVFDMKCDMATKDDLTRLRSHLETRMDSYAAEVEAAREKRPPED